MKPRLVHSIRLQFQLSLLLCCFASPALAEPIPQNATEVLAQMRAASGGGRWDEIRTLHTVTTVIDGGEKEQRDQWEDVETGRNLLRVSGARSFRQTGFDGVTSWIQGRSGIAYTFGDTDSLLAAADEAFRVSRAWWFPERFPATIAFAGSKREKDHRYDLLRITPAGGRPFEAWIDQATHLLARTVEQQADGELITSFADYRMVDGLNLPFTISISKGSGESSGVVQHVQAIDINPPIPDPIYSVPPQPKIDVEFPADRDSVAIPIRIVERRAKGTPLVG
jgi:hypothetical protein